jgi:hypothetical protein
MRRLGQPSVETTGTVKITVRGLKFRSFDSISRLHRLPQNFIAAKQPIKQTYRQVSRHATILATQIKHSFEDENIKVKI